MKSEKNTRALADALKALETSSAERSWTAEEVFDAVHGDLPKARVEELVDMAAADPELADAFRIARALASNVEEKSVDETPDPSSRRSATRSIVLAVASLAAALAVTWIALTPPAEEQNVSPIRAETTYEIASGVDAPKGLPREAFALKWNEGPEGTRYFFEALDLELNVLFAKRHLEKAQVVIPSKALGEVATGEDVIWRVEAYLSDGRTVRSPTFRTLVAD